MSFINSKLFTLLLSLMCLTAAFGRKIPKIESKTELRNLQIDQICNSTHHFKSKFSNDCLESCSLESGAGYSENYKCQDSCSEATKAVSISKKMCFESCHWFCQDWCLNKFHTIPDIATLSNCQAEFWTYMGETTIYKITNLGECVDKCPERG